MEMDERITARATGIAVQSLLAALLARPDTRQIAINAKNTALITVAEVSRNMQAIEGAQDQTERLHSAIEDLFTVVTAFQDGRPDKGSET